MITCHIESGKKILPELMSLLPLHYEELALNKEEVKLSPQFDLYEQYEREGRLLVVTLRELGEIVGYYVGLVAPGLHYSTCLTCITDIFYIRKDKRNGSAGVRLFRYIEKELRRRGVQRWFMGSKVHADASALFKRIGAEPVETYYSKWMGD